MNSICLIDDLIFFRLIQEKNRSRSANPKIDMRCHQKSFQFDQTMDFCCRLLKREKVIESHEFCPTGGFKKVTFKNGKIGTIKCLEDLWKIVPSDKLKNEMKRRDKSGLLRGNGLKFVE